MRNFKKTRKELSWQEILYGLLVIGIILYVIIDASIHDTGPAPCSSYDAYSCND